MKAAAPKKETARISLPPASKPAPQATIKMAQTQPLAAAPVPAVRTTTTTTPAAVVTDSDEAADPLVGILSWVVLIASIAAAAMAYLAYSA